MRYVFDKDSGRVLYKDPTHTLELAEHYTEINGRRLDKYFCDIVDHEYADANSRQELEKYIVGSKEAILNELNQLDKEIPRIVEDIIEHTNYTPHKSKSDIIYKKKQLREQLKTLEG